MTPVVAGSINRTPTDPYPKFAKFKWVRYLFLKDLTQMKAYRDKDGVTKTCHSAAYPDIANDSRDAFLNPVVIAENIGDG